MPTTTDTKAKVLAAARKRWPGMLTIRERRTTPPMRIYRDRIHGGLELLCVADTLAELLAKIEGSAT